MRWIEATATRCLGRHWELGLTAVIHNPDGDDSRDSRMANKAPHGFS